MSLVIAQYPSTSTDSLVIDAHDFKLTQLPHKDIFLKSIAIRFPMLRGIMRTLPEIHRIQGKCEEKPIVVRVDARMAVQV